jgi:hypothetical protein
MAGVGKKYVAKLTYEKESWRAIYGAWVVLLVLTYL